MYSRLSTAVAAQTKKSRKKFSMRDVPWLWVMGDKTRLPDPSTIIADLTFGSGVIVRHTDEAVKSQIAKRVMAARHSARIKVLISDDWRLAAALRCDGVHIPEAAAKTIAPGFRLWRKARRRLVTTSAHGLPALIQTKKVGADLVFLSPVLPTQSHLQSKPLGRFMLALLTRRVKTPIAALGGINASTLVQLNGARVCAVGGVSLL
jgi:thiamine-phosphate pyrophosphorylase